MLNRLGRVTHRPAYSSVVSDPAALAVAGTSRAISERSATSRAATSTWRRSTRAFAVVAVAFGAVILSGCALIEGPTPEAPNREVPAVPELVPTLVPGGTADENLAFFTEVIREYADGDKTIKGEPVSRAVIDAGFDKTLMQVSFDRSETGLEADNIFVSVLFGEGCLIGQIVTADRSFATESAPAVGPENNVCLIGETAAITW